jgi:hypothetical protein
MFMCRIRHLRHIFFATEGLSPAARCAITTTSQRPRGAPIFELNASLDASIERESKKQTPSKLRF